jgi:hypothetical protein
MSRFLPSLAAALFGAVLLAPGVAGAQAQPQTVCTLTINSSDEKDAFGRHLPQRDFRFVELVQRGQPDWLDQACRSGIRCDVLIVSGHFDGHDEFYAEDVGEAPEHLKVSTMEALSCAESCPGVFATVKEVYFFGCNTLNPHPLTTAPASVLRSLVREGHSQQQAQNQLEQLNSRLGDSMRERMRRVFAQAPELYGFASLAPLGPIAGQTLDAYFRAGGPREVGDERRNSRLLAAFAPVGLAFASGVTPQEPQAAVRRDVCQFIDPRIAAAERVGAVHRLLQRSMGEVQMHLERIERLLTDLDDTTRSTPEVARRLESIALDIGARQRFMAHLGDSREPEARVKLLGLARELGWIDEERRWQQLALMLAELLERRELGVREVDLACTLNQTQDLEGSHGRRLATRTQDDDVAHAALRACLGSSEARQRTLAALASPQPAEQRMALAYLRHQPLRNAQERAAVLRAVLQMDAPEPQAQALETLSRLQLIQPEALPALMDLYRGTPSPAVQLAVAGMLIRSDLRQVDRPALQQVLQTLQDHRITPATAAPSLIDLLIQQLIHQLEAPAGP